MPGTSMPRAAMSVATRMRTGPSRKPFSAFWRAFCDLLPWITAAWKPSRSRSRVDAVGAVLGAREHDHRAIAGSASIAGQHLALLLGPRQHHRSARSRRRWCPAAPPRRARGSLSRPRASCSISAGMVAENSAVCRVRMRRLGDPPDVVDEAHVEHAVGLVEHQPARLGQVDVAFARRGRSAGPASRSARRRPAPCASPGCRARRRRAPARWRHACPWRAARTVSSICTASSRVGREDQRARRARQALGAERDDLRAGSAG